MDKRMEENTRVKNAIAKAFFSLLETRSFDEIAVTEITNKAKVSRMAYYRNFNSKLEILEYFLAQIFEAMSNELGEDMEFWTMEYGRVYYRVMKEHRDSILLLDKLGFVPDWWSPNYEGITPENVKLAHEKGIKVVPWTVDDEGEILRMIECDVDAIISNYPERVLVQTRGYGKVDYENE